MLTTAETLECHVYIHDISHVGVVLDQPPLLSSQTLHDAVKGSDGLRQEHMTDRGVPKVLGRPAWLVLNMNSAKLFTSSLIGKGRSGSSASWARWRRTTDS